MHYADTNLYSNNETLEIMNFYTFKNDIFLNFVKIHDCPEFSY